MKLSQWKITVQELIDGVQGEVGMQVPTLEEFRARLNDAAPVTEKRKSFEDEIETFLDSQPFLREAASRYLAKKASSAIETATAAMKEAQRFLPDDQAVRYETTEDKITSEENKDAAQPSVIDVGDAIKSAEQLLPGHAAPEGKSDPRWQAIMKIEDFVEEEPDTIWSFIVRWGNSTDKDLRTAVATLLLEHLLEYHFDRYFPQVEEAAQNDVLFADTFLRCWKLGQAAEAGNAELFEALKAECQGNRPQK
jgi:hypothetical protein